MRKGSRRKPKYADQTPLITNQADVPVGYVQIARMVNDTMPKPATLLKALSDAHRQGKLEAVKLVRRVSEVRTAPVYVDRKQAEAIIKARIADWEREEEALNPVPASASMPLSRTAEMHRRLRAEKKARIEARFDRLESMISEIKEMLREQAAAVGNIQAAMELRLESSSSGLE